MSKKRLTYEEVKAQLSERLLGDIECAPSPSLENLPHSVSYLDYILPNPMSMNTDRLIHKPVQRLYDADSVLCRSFNNGLCSASSTAPLSSFHRVPFVRSSRRSWTTARGLSGHSVNQKLTLTDRAVTTILNVNSHPIIFRPVILSNMPQAASISTRLDEQEFLEMADYYFVTSPSDHISRSGSTTTQSTNHTHNYLRRRGITSEARWRPSTLIECDDSGRATSDADETQLQHDFPLVIESGRTLSRYRGLPNSISLESYFDVPHTFQTDLGNRSVDLDHPIQTPRTDLTLSKPSSIEFTERPMSEARSCFAVPWFPRWNMKKKIYHSSGKSRFRRGKDKNVQTSQFIKHRIRESSSSDYNFSIISLDSESDRDYFASLPLAISSSPLFDLGYDYHLAVEVLINGANIDSETMS